MPRDDIPFVVVDKNGFCITSITDKLKKIIKNHEIDEIKMSNNQNFHKNIIY